MWPQERRQDFSPLTEIMLNIILNDIFSHFDSPSVESQFYSEECAVMVCGVKGLCVCVQDCLKLFSKEERLTDSNRFYCRHCKTHRDAIKKMQIWKVPPILLVHLKR